MRLFRRETLTYWTRDVELSTGRVVRLTYEPVISQGEGILRIDGSLSDAEMREVETALANDRLFARLRA